MLPRYVGVFVKFETNLRKERELERIAKAKEAGVYRGRKSTVDIVRVKALKQEGRAIARTLGIGRASVYRALGEQFRWSAIRTSINVAMKATSERLGTQTLAEGLAIKLADDCLEFSYISRGTKTRRSILGACPKHARGMLRTAREQPTNTPRKRDIRCVLSHASNDSTWCTVLRSISLCIKNGAS